MAKPSKITIEQDTNDIGYDLSLYLDGKPIPWKNINQLLIKESVYSFVPRIEFSFMDDGFFTLYNPVLEGQIIDVVIALNKESDNIVKQTFSILSSSVMQASAVDGPQIISVLGVLNRPSLINKSYNNSYAKQTFSEVLESIASYNNLALVSRIKSSDKMTWYQLNQTDNEFVNDSIYRSYISDDDVPFCYINRDANLIYTSLKTESKKRSDLIFRKDNDKALSKADDVGLDRYYTSFTYADKSGFINSLQGGYGTRMSYYDGNKLVTEDIKSAPFSELTKFKNKLNVNYDKFTNQTMKFGQLNNVYDSYFKSLVTNDLVRKSLFATTVVLNVKPNTYQLFDKINIEIEKGNNLVQSQSGDYLIGSILHNIGSNGRYNQMLVCFRDGVGTSNSTTLFNNPLKEN
tara:strand:+ start:10002 stop:11213 length:1212 start_codon:yes stop_codon:yes gene_type:complete